ncbi:class I SAM-dependent methyltransferase [Chitinibacter sp. FCG-7]|uniref:Class I SAM-dependent methyltransferase n=1 Tax=Chitinibacter mangrovi TaxID=3153927 RepID=A0AAU7FAH2_9NEIS
MEAIMKLTPQKEAFFEEGDQFFLRNEKKYEKNDKPEFVNLFSKYVKISDHVLEVGSGNGLHLAMLTERKNCKASALEPSALAIADGQAKYPTISFYQGTAEKLPLADASVDFLFFGFCLYLIDRSLLCQVIAEADRVLKDGGFIGVVDFDPVTQHRRPYVHRSGIYSYKMNYASLFLAFPQYAEVEKHAFSHYDESFHLDQNERVAAWVLHKSLEQGWPLIASA